MVRCGGGHEQTLGRANSPRPHQQSALAAAIGSFQAVAQRDGVVVTGLGDLPVQQRGLTQPDQAVSVASLVVEFRYRFRARWNRATATS